jgi:hypothetical protein
MGEKCILLTTDEFAKRIRAGRTTIYKWRRSGKLQEGRHFIKIGRIIRFFWSIEILQDISMLLMDERNSKGSESNPKRNAFKCDHRSSSINLDY